MPEIIIDGQALHAEKTQTVMEAARAHGITIPGFCYHPALSVAGNCRLCLVEHEGRGLNIACKLPVQEGMRILTASPAVQDARKAMLQFFTLNHPVDCGICDKSGECLLQDYHYQYNGEPSLSHDPKLQRSKFFALSSRILLDNERCVLCSRCVRFTHEISKSKALGFVQRADHALLRPADPQALEQDAYADNIIDLCPVGALLSRRFFYRARVWYLQATPSICPGCARGCHIHIWHRKPQWQLKSLDAAHQRRIERITPRLNPDINGHFICNKGRDLADIFERPRLLSARLAGAPVSHEAALAQAYDWILKAQHRVAVVSSWGSNEELHAFQDTLGGVFHTFCKADQQPTPGEVIADDWLILADKNPNLTQAQALFGSALPQIDPATDLLLLWGEGLRVEDCPPTARVIWLNAYEDSDSAWLTRADLVIPLSLQTERAGHYTNQQGQVGAFEPCFAKPEGVLDAVDVFQTLALRKAPQPS